MSKPQISVESPGAEPEHGRRSRLSWVTEPSGGLSLQRSRRFSREPLRRRMLALADTISVLAISAYLGTVSADVGAAFWTAVFLPVWLMLAKLHGLYDRDHRALRHMTVDELPSLFMWSLSSTAATTLILLITPTGSLRIQDALAAWLVATAAAFVLRSMARFLWRRTTHPERTLIIGEGPLADVTRRKLDLFPDIHVQLVGERNELTLSELRPSLDVFDDVDRIILASHAIDEEIIAELVAHCRREQIKLSVIPPARGIFGTAVQLNHIADLPVLEYNTWDVSRSTMFLKRALDLLAGTAALLALAPLFLIIALLIRLDSKGPSVFVQWRAGRGGLPFRVYKFRTMVSDAEERLSEVVSLDELRDPMFKLRSDPRVTRIGRLLRRWSLDELPQLINVVRGEMSLVGPRPEQVDLVHRYDEQHRFRLSVKPGLTGPMQVFGRGELTFQERLAVEREYIENLSIGRDLRILAMTIAPVISGKGAF